MNYEAVTFLSMNWNWAKAIEFYKKTFNAKVLFKVTYEEMKKIDKTMIIKEWEENFISHSVLMFWIHKIMIAEESMLSKEDFNLWNNTSICIQSANKTEIEEMYSKIVNDERSNIIMPLANIIFSEAYGIVKDPFWTIFQFMYDTRLSK